MAASQVNSVGGYHCEFIDPVSDDFICKVCNCVAREPNLTVCCGQHYCQSCIMKIVEDGKPCPNPECGEGAFNAVLNKNCKRKILALHVHCTMKEHGCQWMGRLEQLDTHVDVNTGDCQYVEIECPEKCGQQVQKHQLTTHIADKCPKREFACIYCDFKATYEVVNEQHWPECQNYPVPCPNRCQIGAVERNTLEDHLNMCNLQVVECDFSYAGCNEKLQRQDMEKHVEENTQKHLALMAAASMKMSQGFEKKLQEQQGEFQGYLKQKERETAEQLQRKGWQIKAVQEQLQSLQKDQKEGEQQLQQQLEQKEKQIKHIQEEQEQRDQEKQWQIEALKEQIIQVKQDHEERIKVVEQRRDEQIKSLEVQSQQQVERIEKLEKQLKEKEQELEQLKCDLIIPFHFTMSNFNHLKSKDGYGFSPPMYTHLHGYKFCMKMYPNGTYLGKDVSVELYTMSGEFDDTLQWPAKFTITLQLLNLHRDQDHITVTKQFRWNKPEGKTVYVGYFTDNLIAHTDLKLNAQKQTQYLKDDSLHFRITKIDAEGHSMSLSNNGEDQSFPPVFTNN